MKTPETAPSVPETSGSTPARETVPKIPGPKGRALLERDRKVMSPSYPRGVPLVMSHGKGTEIWDLDGNRFLDFAAGIAVCSTGHAHPRVVAAIQEQAARFIHISSDFYHPMMLEAAERIAAVVPIRTEDPIVFLGNSGTEMIEGALKLARYHTRRPNFIGFLGGFHGRTMGSVSFTSSKAKQRAHFFPMMPGVMHVPFPDPRRPLLDTAGGDAGDAVIRYLEDVVFKQLTPADEVAAFLIEPIQGEGGYVVPPPSFFPQLRALCDRHGILLIADEVQSGMGRTGKWFAIDNWGVEADIVCVAKGVASGMPLGAMVARKSIVTWGPGTHGNTYGGNPISCAAAIATMKVIEEEGLLGNAKARGDAAMALLRGVMSRHDCIGDVRGIGLMIGVEFVRPAKDGKGEEADLAMAEAVVEAAFQRGLILLECGRSVIRIAPPLNLSAAHLEEGIRIFEESIVEAKAARASR